MVIHRFGTMWITPDNLSGILKLSFNSNKFKTMKEKLRTLGLMLLVYTLSAVVVMVVLLFAIVTASFVAWNMKLFNPDVLASIFRISIILGLALGSWAMYKDWDGLMETIDDED